MSNRSRILVVYAHPISGRSRSNQRLLEAATTVSNVTVDDLYETYPDFYIDVEREQALLAQADLIVFQHPIQWYGMPSLLKEWMDVVLEYGWAYGREGTALHGKDFWPVVTTGGTDDPDQDHAAHGHEFAVFQPPLEQVAKLCGLRWQMPFVLHGANLVDDAVIDAHAAQYRERLLAYPQWAHQGD